MVGNLYGLTPYGGSAGQGVVYELDLAGNETVLYSFTGGADGGEPFARSLIRDSAGNLYGTTQFGGQNCPSPRSQRADGDAARGVRAVPEATEETGLREPTIQPGLRVHVADADSAYPGLDTRTLAGRCIMRAVPPAPCAGPPP